MKNEQAIEVLKEVHDRETRTLTLTERDALSHALTILENLTEENIWKILAEVHGCKKDKEDCSFKKCHHWATCDILAQAIITNLSTCRMKK